MNSLPAWWSFFGHPDFRKQTFFFAWPYTFFFVRAVRSIFLRHPTFLFPIFELQISSG